MAWQPQCVRGSMSCSRSPATVRRLSGLRMSVSIRSRWRSGNHAQSLHVQIVEGGGCPPPSLRGGEEPMALLSQQQAASLERKFDIIILVAAFTGTVAGYHIHQMLTVGDWDFWLDRSEEHTSELQSPL